MRRTSICIGFVVWLLSAAQAQQDAQISMYLRNPVQFNSAHAGTDGTLRVTAISRLQWVGWDGAPRTSFFSAHAPVLRDRMGIGVTMVTDKSGARGHNEFMAHAAYHLPEIKGIQWSAGLSLGFQNNHYDFSNLQVHHPGDLTQEMPYSETAFNAGFGVLGYKDGWYAGLSVPHLIEQSMGHQSTGPVQRRHWYLTGGKIIPINQVINARFCGLLKRVSGAPMTLDINGEIWFYDLIALGAMCRFNEGFGFQGSYLFRDEWRFHYAVDFPLNGLMNGSFGSHEIGIAWDFGRKPLAYKSPRYF